jgi:hypothetical protein
MKIMTKNNRSPAPSAARARKCHSEQRTDRGELEHNEHEREQHQQ